MVIHRFLEFLKAVGRRCKTPGHLDFQFQGRVYLSCVSKEDRTDVLTEFPGQANSPIVFITKSDRVHGPNPGCPQTVTIVTQ